MAKIERLISKTAFRALAKKGAKAEDFGDALVFLPSVGKIISKDIASAPAGSPITFICSNGDVDREGDSIDIKGWDYTDYLRNPVVLWAHSHDDLPVARATNVRIDSKNLLADDIFTSPDLHPFGHTVERMVRAGFLNAVSVGFQPVEFEPRSGDDYGIDFKSQKLLEHSVCPVPALQSALVQRSLKDVDLGPISRWCEEQADTFHLKGDAADVLRDQVQQLARAMGKVPVRRQRRTDGFTSDAAPALTAENLAALKLAQAKLRTITTALAKSKGVLVPSGEASLRGALGLIDDVLRGITTAERDHIVVDGEPIVDTDIHIDGVRLSKDHLTESLAAAGKRIEEEILMSTTGRLL